MDVDEADLPDTILNIYLQEAFDRTMAMSNQWPRQETMWAVTVLPGTSYATLPPDCNQPGILSVLAQEGYKLVQIDQSVGENNFSTTETVDSEPLYYSIWSSQMTVWPLISMVDPYSMVVRGYRQPVWTNGASDIPDLDDRLHATLAYFALSLAYAQQEDDVLEAAYLARWNRDLMQQLKVMFEPRHQKPLVMNGGSPVGGAPTYRVILPE